MSDFERLNTEGFLWESVAVRGEGLFASYGSGFGEGVVIGHPEGVMTWRARCSALPDYDDFLIDAGVYGLQTRERYLWDFYVRHNVNNCRKPFWLRDPKTSSDYLAEIVEEQLDYSMLCLKVSSTGLTLRQRRVAGVGSPSSPTDVVNPSSI